MRSLVTFQKDMYFKGECDGFEIPLDADVQFGGQGLGPRPKGLTLTSLAGCTAMDVISILRKMKIEPEAFSVDASADLAEEHPRVFERVKLIYRFKGRDLPLDKLKKAIKLSQDRYCGISAMLKTSTPIDWEIELEE